MRTFSLDNKIPILFKKDMHLHSVGTENVWEDPHHAVSRHGLSRWRKFEGGKGFSFLYFAIVWTGYTEHIVWVLKRETKERVNHPSRKMTEGIYIKKLSLGHFNFLITNFLYSKINT